MTVLGVDGWRGRWVGALLEERTVELLLLDDAAKRRALGAANRARAEAVYSEQAMVETWARLLGATPLDATPLGGAGT